MRVSCLFIHRLPVQVERGYRDNLTDEALIVGGFPFEGKVVYDASPEAIACGVKEGMPLAQASVLCPEACFLPSDEKRYWQIFEEVIGLLEQFSAVEVEELGCAYFDINGFENEPELAREIATTIFRQTKLRACLGIASNKFIAKTAAFVTKSEVPVIVGPGDEKSFIAPFAVSVLPCSKQTKERLRLLGVHIVGELARFSKESLISQFGEEGISLYELARGVDNTPLKPRPKPRVAREAISLDNPVNTLDRVIPVMERIIDKIALNLKKEWQVCHRINLRLSLSPNSTLESTFVLKQATNSPQIMLLRLKPWLAQLNLPKEVSSIEISLELSEDKGAQPSLWSKGRYNPVDESLARVLKQKWGYQPLKKAITEDLDALLPENRFKLIDLE